MATPARRLRSAALAAFLWPAAAAAAPFCVATQAVPPRCLYTDAAGCQAEAQREHGFCAANPAEALPHRGGEGFCVSAAGVALECAYRDRAPCERSAARTHAACVAAPFEPPGSVPDPFSLRRPY